MELSDMCERAVRLYEQYSEAFLRAPHHQVITPGTAVRRDLLERCGELTRLHDDIADEWRRRASDIERWSV